VVDWATVRIILIIAVALGLYTRQIDFRNAFVQSWLPKPIYLEMPQGFERPGKVLKVKKSLYGDKRAPKLWLQHLRAALLRIGFTQSLHDPCLFFKAGVIFIVYVDDGIFVAIDNTLIDQAISDLRNEHFDLEEEDDYAGYLGISLDRQPNGSINMLQTGLINRILCDLGFLDSVRTKSVPSVGLLGPCLDSKPFC
jgi:Reverse transcriptase (RNA-dependent DNA polymerase)